MIVADGHPRVRRGIRRLLEEGLPGAVLAEASDAEGLLALAGGGGCDLVVLDMDLPGSGGLELVSRLRAALPAARLLVLGFQPEEQYAEGALRAGADACRSKGGDPRGILEAARAALGL